MVSSMIAFTISLALFLSALMARFRPTSAWLMTKSMSFSSIPVSSTSSPSSESSLTEAPTAVLPIKSESNHGIH